jgi:VWFA-related protein
MPHGFTSSIAVFMAAGAVAAGAGFHPGPIGQATGSVQPRTRTVHVSVTDKKGGPVTDMQAAEFEVKEGGKTRDVVRAEIATRPLRIAMLVADGGTGMFQRSLAFFMERLLGHAEFALTSVVVQPETVVDYSSDAAALSAGLSRMAARGRERGAQLLEAIQDATKDVRSEDRRPVIVVMRVGGEAATTLAGEDVRAQLRKSGAILYVISTVGAQRGAPPQARGTDPVSIAQGQLRDDELTQSAHNLAQVLGDGSKESGGRHDEVVSTTLVPALQQVASELLNQYEITYVLPDDVKPSDRISVSSKRKDVKVQAPSRRPN